MPRSELGPWGKLYASLADDAAHFTDRQFRAYVETLCVAIRGRGELPKLRPLRARMGAAEIDFLVEEGRLSVDEHNAVTVTGWQRYNAPVDRTNATRQARFRERHAQFVDTVDNGVTVTRVPTSTSSNVENDEEKNGASDAPDVARPTDFDALDRYHELTGLRPWGGRSGAWLRELQAKHGIPNTIAALEVEHRDHPGDRSLLSNVAARLERQADRVAEAKRKEPKPVDPVQAQMRAALAARERSESGDPPVGDPAAGRRAFGALRGNLGPLTPAAAVVSSPQNGSSRRSDPTARVLTAGEGSDTASAARPAASRVEANSFAPRDEPGAPEPSRSEASTDEAHEGDRA